MLNNSLTIADLIASLTEMAEVFGEDTLVVSSSDYGDYAHTEQLVEIQDIQACNPVKTGYSHSGYAFSDEDLDDSKPMVIVLRGVL